MAIEMSETGQRRPLSAAKEMGVITAASASISFALYPPRSTAIEAAANTYAAFAAFGSANVEWAADGNPSVRTRLRAGEIVFVAPARNFVLKRPDAVEMLRLCVDPPRVDRLITANTEKRPIAPGMLTHRTDPGLAALTQEIRRSLVGDQLSNAVYLDALAESMLLRLLCGWLGELDDNSNMETLSPAKLARILQAINAGLEGTIRVEALASQAGLSRSHFSRAFQKATGDPPQRFILKRRICRARDLLSADGATIAEVAVRSGFSSQAHLATAFRDELGVTPSDYRRAFSHSSD